MNAEFKAQTKFDEHVCPTIQLRNTIANGSDTERIQNFKLPFSKDGDVLMGKLMINFQGKRHSISGGELGQAFTSAMIAIGHRSELTLGIAARAYIDGRCRISDYTAEPKRRDPGEGNGGRMEDGYGFLFPNLVVEIAVSESRSDLLADLRTWISDQTSVQVAIGIKIYTRRGSTVDGPLEGMEAIVFRRRNVQNPDHVVQLYPATEDPPVLTIHLSDIFFGSEHPLPMDLARSILHDETIAIDLSDFVDSIIYIGNL